MEFDDGTDTYFDEGTNGTTRGIVADTKAGFSVGHKMMYGQTDGPPTATTNRRTDGRRDGARNDGWTGGQTGGRTDGQTDGRTDGRKGGLTFLFLSLAPQVRNYRGPS